MASMGDLRGSDVIVSPLNTSAKTSDKTLAALPLQVKKRKEKDPTPP
jgi:hypothetical protein